MSNQARVKQQGKFASDDDASNLLADILNDTAMDAQAEQRRIEAELKAREEEERRLKEAEDRRKQEEAQARLHAEQSRQNQVLQRRTEKLQALKIEELKQKGEWVDPAIEEAKQRAEQERQRQAAMQQAIQQQLAQQQLAQQQQLATQHAPTPEATKPKSKGPVMALVAVIALVLVAGGALAALTLGAYKPDNVSYAKITINPASNAGALTLAAFAPIPKAEVAAAPSAESGDDDKPSKRSSGKKLSSRGDSGKKDDSKKDDDKKTKKDKPKVKGLDLGNDDIFGGGF
jgi:hypothetical protein